MRLRTLISSMTRSVGLWREPRPLMRMTEQKSQLKRHPLVVWRVLRGAYLVIGNDLMMSAHSWFMGTSSIDWKLPL